VQFLFNIEYVEINQDDAGVILCIRGQSCQSARKRDPDRRRKPEKSFGVSLRAPRGRSGQATRTLCAIVARQSSSAVIVEIGRLPDVAEQRRPVELRPLIPDTGQCADDMTRMRWTQWQQDTIRVRQAKDRGFARYCLPQATPSAFDRDI
jgi:hypothetical protein